MLLGCRKPGEREGRWGERGGRRERGEGGRERGEGEGREGKREGRGRDCDEREREELNPPPGTRCCYTIAVGITIQQETFEEEIFCKLVENNGFH